MRRARTFLGQKPNPSRPPIRAVDLHIHGAFGIDLVHAQENELTLFSKLLKKKGTEAFCPTLLSLPQIELESACSRIGKWIRSTPSQGARPLGIHLEGPFLNPFTRGAHPEKSVRAFSRIELETLWTASQQTLRILTLAPELLTKEDAKWVVQWAKKNRIRLSIGHSRASCAEAQQYINQGFSGVTHLFNAMPFHQRAPGIPGAALGNPNATVEMIIDPKHVAPELMHWATRLHAKPSLIFVSDAVASAETTQGKYTLGDLEIEFKEGASRTAHGELAGAGYTLGTLYKNWIKTEAKRLKVSAHLLDRQFRCCIEKNPLTAVSALLPFRLQK